jgi:hypothetical protein
MTTALAHLFEAKALQRANCIPARYAGQLGHGSGYFCLEIDDYGGAVLICLREFFKVKFSCFLQVGDGFLDGSALAHGANLRALGDEESALLVDNRR